MGLRLLRESIGRIDKFSEVLDHELMGIRREPSDSADTTKKSGFMFMGFRQILNAMASLTVALSPLLLTLCSSTAVSITSYTLRMRGWSSANLLPRMKTPFDTCASIRRSKIYQAWTMWLNSRLSKQLRAMIWRDLRIELKSRKWRTCW